jgi:TP901 family phage tail tape measure protein
MASEVELERMVVRIMGDNADLLKTYNNSLAATEKFATRVANKMKTVGRKMSLLLTTPIIGLAAASIKAGADFEQAFGGVVKTVEGTKEQLDDLKKGFKELALVIPVSAVELLKIGEAAGQLGIKTENVLAFTEVMAKMAVTTNLSAEEAATMMAKFANITGMSQHLFENLGSSIVDLGNNLATTERDIVTMSLRLASAGKQVGMSEAQIVGMAAALSSVGLEAEAGGTAFSQLLSKISLGIAVGSEEIKTFARVSNLSVEKFSKLFRDDAAGAVSELLRGLKELSVDDAAIALEDMGITGIRLQDAIRRASGAVDLFDTALKTSTKAFKENTALSKEAKIAFESFWSQVKLLKNAFGQLMGDVFQVLRPMLTSLIENVKGIAADFKGWSDESKKLAVQIALVVAAIGPLLIVVGTLITSYTTLIPLIVAASAAFTAFNIRTTAIAITIGTVAVSLYKASAAVRDLNDALSEGESIDQRTNRRFNRQTNEMLAKAKGMDDLDKKEDFLLEQKRLNDFEKAADKRDLKAASKKMKTFNLAQRLFNSPRFKVASAIETTFRNRLELSRDKGEAISGVLKSVSSERSAGSARNRGIAGNRDSKAHAPTDLTKKMASASSEGLSGDFNWGRAVREVRKKYEEQDSKVKGASESKEGKKFTGDRTIHAFQKGSVATEAKLRGDDEKEKSIGLLEEIRDALQNDTLIVKPFTGGMT